MRVEAQITPEVLAWARDTAGYSVDQVVEKLKQKKVSPETIVAWEKGEAKPSYAQLEKLAEYYKRPIAVFYFPSPPEEDDIDKKFRSLPEDYSQSLPPHIRYLVRKASARQLSLHELYGSFIPEHIQNLRNRIAISDANRPQELATKMREIIGISLAEQFSWKNCDEAMKHWRKALEDLGIWVFKDAFKDKNYSGFYLHDESLPVIYINSSIAKQRQIFTLFHELGHLVLGKGGISFRENMERKFTGRHRDEEVFCNGFAGAFLVPDNSLTGLSAKPDDEKILHYAKQYGVSREVILRKYLDRKLINKDFYNEKVSVWREDWEDKKSKNQSDSGAGGPNYYVVHKAHLGDKYLNLVFSQYYDQRIDQDQAADYLDIKVQSLDPLEGFMYQGDS